MQACGADLQTDGHAGRSGTQAHAGRACRQAMRSCTAARTQMATASVHLGDTRGHSAPSPSGQTRPDTDGQSQAPATSTSSHAVSRSRTADASCSAAATASAAGTCAAMNKPPADDQARFFFFFFHGRNVTRDNTPPAQGAVHQNTGKYNPDMGHVRKVPEYEA